MLKGVAAGCWAAFTEACGFGEPSERLLCWHKHRRRGWQPPSGAAHAPCNEGLGPRTFRSNAQPIPRLSHPTWMWHPKPGRQMPQVQAEGGRRLCLALFAGSLQLFRTAAGALQCPQFQHLLSSAATVLPVAQFAGCRLPPACLPVACQKVTVASILIKISKWNDALI